MRRGVAGAEARAGRAAVLKTAGWDADDSEEADERDEKKSSMLARLLFE
jgi:hypothetical protein